MANTKITQLPASAGLVATDLVPVVDDPSGTPVTQKATWAQVRTYILASDMSVTGTLASSGALTVSSGGATITGNSTITGTLGGVTQLNVDNLRLDGNTLSATTGAVNITPLAGSAIVLDGTISVDAGVVTGATSITSTAFVGALTGAATSAATWTTPRTIWGQSVDGSGNITGALTVATGGANITGDVAIGTGELSVTSTTSPQVVARYDSSNRLDLSVSSTGVVTLDAVGASALFILSDGLNVNGALQVGGVTTVAATGAISTTYATTSPTGRFITTPVTAYTASRIHNVVLMAETSDEDDASVGANYAYAESGESMEYASTNEASRIRFQNGTITLQCATGGSAGSTITWANALITNTSGYVGLGTASAATSTFVNTPAATTSRSSIRLPHGTAPSSPVDGDMWTTTAGLYVRINGSTIGPLS